MEIGGCPDNCKTFCTAYCGFQSRVLLVTQVSAKTTLHWWKLPQRFVMQKNVCEQTKRVGALHSNSVSNVFLPATQRVSR